MHFCPVFDIYFIEYCQNFTFVNLNRKITYSWLKIMQLSDGSSLKFVKFNHIDTVIQDFVAQINSL